MDSYTVSKKFLDDVISTSSSALCGMVMKRFEILEDKEDIKRAIKELVYENGRNIKSLIKSFGTGVVFNSPKA